MIKMAAVRMATATATKTAATTKSKLSTFGLHVHTNILHGSNRITDAILITSNDDNYEMDCVDDDDNNDVDYGDDNDENGGSGGVSVGGHVFYLYTAIQCMKSSVSRATLMAGA